MWKVNEFGCTKSGEKVLCYTATNGQGMEVTVTTFGASITSIKVPDKHGHVDDVVTGYDNATGYEEGGACFGGTLGRCTNRIGSACFSLDNVTYHLAKNDGCNSIHGGLHGFHKKVWHAKLDGDSLVMSYTSADLEEGYPGEVKVKATYNLGHNNELCLEYAATCDKPTIVNMTNHAYFNLAGHKSTTISDHLIQINAEKFTPKDEHNIPTGELARVHGTVFDLRKPMLLGNLLDQIPGNVGYDHNYCITADGQEKTFVARVEHESSGRTLCVYSNQPGVQLYTAYYLDNEAGKDGAVYSRYSCLALETQNYPDAINKANFPSCVLRPGQTYKHLVWFKFGVK